MAFTVGLKRLLFAPTITRNRGTPGPCWGLLHRDADATTAARQPARAATTTVDRQPSGMYLQLSSSHPAPSCSCRIMCAILQLNKIERRFSSLVLVSYQVAGKISSIICDDAALTRSHTHTHRGGGVNSIWGRCCKRVNTSGARVLAENVSTVC